MTGLQLGLVLVHPPAFGFKYEPASLDSLTRIRLSHLGLMNAWELGLGLGLALVYLDLMQRARPVRYKVCGCMEDLQTLTLTLIGGL